MEMVFKAGNVPGNKGVSTVPWNKGKKCPQIAFTTMLGSGEKATEELKAERIEELVAKFKEVWNE